MKLIKFFIMFFFAVVANAQSEIDFTNGVIFSKTGNIAVIRFVALIPAPITNEYQEISTLAANHGRFITIDNANKVLFYDGAFEGSTMSILESFKYRTKPVRIDFSNKSSKNIVSGIDPNNYLSSDGTYIDLDNSTIKTIGTQLWNQSKDKLDYARRCYEYVATHYKYINGSWRTLADIIKTGGGECGDFTTLFVNLMRYKGIPARHNMGVWVNGGYHVWPDFYHEDYGWVPVDPTFKNSNPQQDYFGRYDGNLIILSQGLTSFSESEIKINDEPLQTFYYWYWNSDGQGWITAVHQTSNAYLVDGIEDISMMKERPRFIYNQTGMRMSHLSHGINIVDGKKIFVK